MNATIAEVPSDIVRLIPPERRLATKGLLTEREGTRLLKAFADLQTSEGDILWTVDSNGGHFRTGIDVCSAFYRSERRVIGLVEGTAGSAAFMALQGCQWRLATASSTLRIHNPVWINFDTELRFDSTEDEYVEEHRQFFHKCLPRVQESRELTVKILYARSLGLDLEALSTLLREAKPMSPVEAIEVGFLDAVCETDA